MAKRKSGGFYVAKDKSSGKYGIFHKKPAFRTHHIQGKVYGPFKSHRSAGAMQKHLESGGLGINPSAVERRFLRHRAKNLVPYQVWTYDVWGNAKDGYVVNDRFEKGIVELPREPSTEEILRGLRREGYVDKRVSRRLLEIDGEPDYTFYLSYKGRPELELENVEGR